MGRGKGDGICEVPLRGGTDSGTQKNVAPVPFPNSTDFEEVHQAARAVLHSEPIPAGRLKAELEPGTEPLPSGLAGLIGLSGKARAGKDTIADFILSRYASVARLNFSDPIIAETNHWLEGSGHLITEENKSERLYRHLLQSWGLARRAEQPDYWTRQLERRVKGLWEDGSELVLLCGVRTPSDLDLVESLGGLHWRVSRPGNLYQTGHKIETMLDQLPEEKMTVIENTSEGDLDALHLTVERALRNSASRGPA